MLFTLQRYEFFSKSQPLNEACVNASRCCLPCKGTNFLANHNTYLGYGEPEVDVVYLAKVRIFQQITTCNRYYIYKCQMLFTLQRYEFFSKSQHNLAIRDKHLGCCLPCKGTNFLANHNRTAFTSKLQLDVVYLAKVRIFQQITTQEDELYEPSMMLFTLQRYEFFSKSQRNTYKL